MNTIEAIKHQTEFVPAPHLVVAIDGTPLDALLAAAFPHRDFKGLVPTLLDWIDDDRERLIVWQRILPTDDRHSIVPVLMCPDDLDFWCTIVVAEVSGSVSRIHWHRLGLDVSKAEDLPTNIGADVDWLEGVGPFTFDRAMYERMLEAFGRSATPPNFR